MIRNANKNDIDQLMIIAESMHAESRYSLLRFSEAKTRQFFNWLIDSDETCLFVAEKKGAVIGGISGYSMAHWASDDKIASDFGLFILPEHRGGITAIKLLRAFKSWAESTGAKLTHIGITTGVNTEETAGLYQAVGCKKIGYLFSMGD